MRPSGKDEAIISLKTKTKREIEIKVEAGYCSLHNVRDSELRHLDEKKLLPAELLTQLGECGLFLLPEQKSKSIREHVTPKVIFVFLFILLKLNRISELRGDFVPISREWHQPTHSLKVDGTIRKMAKKVFYSNSRNL